jgi:Family of unknown function (DUF6262)
MRPDNTAPITAAARRRHDQARARATQALRELDRAGTPVTFESAAAAAGVSRSWLYTQPDLRAEVERLRAATRQAPSPPVPTRQRASEAALLTRLEAALQRNRELADDNQRLRRQLAHALGDQRKPPTGHADSRPHRNSPENSPTTIGPR